ncbi:hypothetical protein [Neorhizobium sp. LjRoot104]|uniref:hypothetical protein n=1 Tax=Neorhizobium sp. LjRoot104 TaxID=3342254 RepID=UPI003ED15D35
MSRSNTLFILANRAERLPMFSARAGRLLLSAQAFRAFSRHRSSPQGLIELVH